jgi:hypothetical protein
MSKSAPPDPEPRSSWTGNAPPVVPAGPRSATRSAPRFTDSGRVQAPRAPAPGPRAERTPAERTPAATLRPAPRMTAPEATGSVPSGPYVGTSLTEQEILGILAHAGSGCPLGPCLGCRHHDVQTGSCTA